MGRLTWLRGTVLEINEETLRTKSLVIQVPGWEGHLPGQHVDIRLTAEDGYQAERSYSIASAPHPVPEQDRIELTVERLGDGEVSPYLTEDVQVGDQLELRGPIGGYFVWDALEGGPLFLVAGGSGVVPLMAMIRHRTAIGSQVPTRLLYSVRSPSDVIYRAELERVVAADATLDVVYTFTRVRPTGWTGYTRRIDAAMLAEVEWSPRDNPRIFVCGPSSLVETVASALVVIGHDPKRVKTERFGPSG